MHYPSRLGPKVLAILLPAAFVVLGIGAFAAAAPSAGGEDWLRANATPIAVGAGAALVGSLLGVLALSRSRPASAVHEAVAGADDVVADSTEAEPPAGETVSDGLNRFVINLARRNQGLLDRQIDLIDRLEAKENDPQRLEQLFELDHMATRMRRTAESMLVVAGAEANRRRNGEVAMLDVVRVALSEIEDYRQVVVGHIDEVTVNSAAGVDIAHLLSELLENATQFSPPDTPVHIFGSATQGRYTFGVVDRGIGMAAEDLERHNRVLAEPPELRLDMDRSMGFVVVGRLAGRIGASVELAATEGGGVTVRVSAPLASLVPGSTLGAAPVAAEVPAVLTEPGAVPTQLEAVPTEPEAELTPERRFTDHPPAVTVSVLSGATAAPERRPEPDVPTPPLTPQPPSRPEGLPSTLAEAMPEAPDFDGGIAQLLRPDTDLVARDPGQSLDGHHTQDVRPVSAPQRTPEEMSDMLSRFRDGFEQGSNAEGGGEQR